MGKQWIISMQLVRSSSCIHLQHSPVVIQLRDVLEQTPPDANVVESNTHPSSCQRMPHVVSVAQEKHACKRQTVVCLASKIHGPVLVSFFFFFFLPQHFVILQLVPNTVNGMTWGRWLSVSLSFYFSYLTIKTPPYTKTAHYSCTSNPTPAFTKTDKQFSIL